METIPPPFGGISSFVARILYYLSRDGFRVGGFYSQLETKTIFFGDTSKIEFFKWKTLRLSKALSQLPRLVLQSRNFSILHFHSDFENAFYIWFFSALLKKKVVVSLHNAFIEHSVKTTNVVNRFFAKFITQGHNIHWVAVSEGVKESLLRTGLNFRNVSVIPAYIPPFQSYVRSIIPDDLGSFLQSRRPIFCVYSHMLPMIMANGEDAYKLEDAFSVFAKILSKHKNAGIVVYVNKIAEQKFYENLLKQVKSLGIEASVYWQLTPVVDMSEVWKKTDVYLRPTSTDGDSVAIREALAYGCSVVASDVTKRPDGSWVFRYGDLADFENMVLEALSSSRQSKQDLSGYEAMVKLYTSMI